MISFCRIDGSTSCRQRREMTTSRKRNLLLGLVSTLLLQTPNWVSAQFHIPASPGIAVEGSGDMKMVPDVVEINVRLTARGELTDDAVVKHRDARKRTMETFQALKLDN